MRINNNLIAMNTHRQYSINNTNVSKAVEKLSSGYRINRAGDDAAGLAISEKMRAQIRGLGMASKNSQDGISLIQTAEGALQESHNILQRMRELAVQSASDTNETTIDRDALNKEFQAMLDEIDDTAAKTTFNDLGLIDGTFAKFKVDNDTGVSPQLPAPAKIFANALAQGATNAGVHMFSFTYTAPNTPIAAVPVAEAGALGSQDDSALASTLGTSLNVAFTADSSDDAKDISLNGDWTFARSAGGAWVATNSVTGRTISGAETFTDVDTSGNTIVDMNSGDTLVVNFAGLGEITFTATGDATDFANAVSVGGTYSVSGAESIVVGGTSVGSSGANPTFTYSYTDDSNTVQTISVNLFAGQKRIQLENGVAIDFGQAIAPDYSNLATIFGATTPVNTYVTVEDTGFEFVVQTGSNKGDELNLNIDKMDTKTLGIFGADISFRENASWAIQHVNHAVNAVSTQRAALGAMQNRMEHKIANLDTSAENLQSAESRIRDLDMAKEMTSFTKNNILSQASTAMLAQANSLPQGVLQLLQ